MSYIPKPHEIYKHFKGNLYQIIAIAEHSETAETMVVYQALYGEFKIYVRPLEMFVSKVDREKYPTATQEYRFTLQNKATDAVSHAANSLEDVAADNDAQERNRTTKSESTVQEIRGQALQQGMTEQAEELNIDPMVLEFLEADTYEQRLNILTGLHHRITDEMITTMAVASDVEVRAGDVETRYEELRSCLLTLEKYECNRVR